MNRFNYAITAMMGMALSVSASAAELQWGFDFSSDTVSNQNGGIVVNDGTGGTNLDGQVWVGAESPAYSADIPPALWRQNTTGIGSVNVQSPPEGDVGHLRTVGTTSDFASSADLIAAGGLTIEVWVKHLQLNTGGDDFMLAVGDWFVLADAGNASTQGGSDTGGSRYKLIMNSSSRATPSYPLSAEAKVAAGWTHLAGVLIPGAGDNNTTRLYVDGILRSEKTGLADSDVNVIDVVAGRSICAGGAHNFPTLATRFQGLIYEPRVTLAELTPSEFTANTGDSDGDGLVDLWEYKNFTNLTFTTGAGDVDFDDATNQEEMLAGTNPLDPDSDADGLADGVETGTGILVDLTDTGTQAQVADTDGDGLIDGAEILVYGSDPFEDDIDFDGSPDIVEITLGTDPNDLFDDPIDYFNLLMGNMAVGDDWNTGLFFNFFSADADDVWVIGDSGPGYGQLIRSPEGPGTTFPNVALILSGNGATLRLKQDNGETVTVNDLRLRGGTVDNGNTSTTQVLGGMITVESSGVSNQATLVTTDTSTNVTFEADIDSVIELFDGSRNLIVDATIDGTSGLIVQQSASSDESGTLSIRSMDNPYSGTWTVRDGALLKGTALNSLGTGSIRIEDGILDSDYALALLNSTLTLADPAGALVLDKDHYVGAMNIGATAVAPGTYTAAQLAALADPAYSDALVDGGGTITVTGIGAGDADGNGIPDAWEVAEFGSNGQDPDSDSDDTDGLTIKQEFAAGTDPQNNDSDGDTLLDGAEVFTHGTDPSKADTDGDTLRDDAEMVGVDARPPTNPLSVDTDGDSLSDTVESNSGTFVDANDTGTDPTNVDSDGDLFNDDLEVAEGSDPTDPNSVPLGFSDDFEAYPVSDPADFSATGNWTWNGVTGPSGSDSRIFATGNYGGTQLWIAHPNAVGSGITSSGIALDANTLYTFRGNLVAETSDGSRDNEYTVDLLIGADAGSAVSVLGGPVTVIGRGDGNGTTPPGSIDDSYEDQVTEIGFNSGAMAPSDRLFIQIVYVGPGPSNNPGFAAVDNISIVSIADADGDLLPDQWEVDNFGSITNWVGTDDPDLDLLDNLGELARGTDPNDPDTDNDGLNDNVETGTGTYVSASDTGTDPLAADTDGDGLEDGVESNTGTFVDLGDTGTDPTHVDTDGDTFGDGTEIAAGSNPLLITSIPEWCSSAFAVRYEATADVPSVENASEGWVEAGPAASGGAGVVWSNGTLLIDSYDTTTNASTAGGNWIENPSGGAWGAAVSPGNPSHVCEARVRVLANAGSFGLVIWAGHQGDPGIALANITTNGVYWGADLTQPLSDTNGIDNATDFHTYRVLYNADMATYSVYRDGILLADGLGAGNPNTQTRIIVGDIGGAGSVKAELDYFRWDVGIPWTPSPADADCDGDGLLNNQEDLNGNGSVDPGETDQGNPDTDGDGAGDGDEVLVAGTDPTDAASVFKVIDADVSPTGQLTWSSVPGKTYRVQFTPSLNPSTWTDLADIPADETGDSTSVTDPTPAGTEGHYRVLVIP